jgi:hypothetical protein
MRIRYLARRITAVPALALALALAVAACSSGASTTTSTSSSTPASAPASSAASSPAGSPAASSSPAGGNNAAAVAQITANWEKFFNSSTPVSEKVKLLQNGTALQSAIQDLSNLPLASNIGAKVTNVTVNSATSASVTYNITSGGSSLLSGQKGTSVYQGGVWKVGDASLCGLLKLVPGGSVPAACNSAG